VVVSARREAEGREVVAEIERAGGAALFVATDVTRDADVERLISRAIETFGRIDALVNNAGTEAGFGPIEDLSEAQLERSLDVNLKGSWRVLRRAIPALLASRGAVVNVSSVVGERGVAGSTAYAAAKAGLAALTRSAAIELAGRQVRVNAVMFGPVMTDMLVRVFGGESNARAYASGAIPLGRLGEPEEAAAAISFLLSNDARWITGTSLCVDGGLTARMP
jgi:NAD(P)-dependent dehydrogenase (short-subunit alcohol dehydrogenase family)